MAVSLINQEAEGIKAIMRWRDAKKGNIPHGNKPSLVIPSLFLRIKAFIVDSFMILMPILYGVFYVVLGSREGFKANMTEGWIWVLGSHFVIITLFLMLKGQTPGYKAYALKLIDTRTLQYASFIKLSLRYILYLLTIISVIGLLVPLFRKDKCALYDILTQTIIVENLQSSTK